MRATKNIKFFNNMKQFRNLFLIIGVTLMLLAYPAGSFFNGIIYRLNVYVINKSLLQYKKIETKTELENTLLIKVIDLHHVAIKHTKIFAVFVGQAVGFFLAFNGVYLFLIWGINRNYLSILESLSSEGKKNRGIEEQGIEGTQRSPN